MLQLNIPAEEISTLQELTNFHPHQLVRRKSMALLLKNQGHGSNQVNTLLPYS